MSAGLLGTGGYTGLKDVEITRFVVEVFRRTIGLTDAPKLSPGGNVPEKVPGVEN